MYSLLAQYRRGIPDYAEDFARQRIVRNIKLKDLFAAIDADPSIVGAGVVYIDADFNVIVLREFLPLCSILPKRIILREARPKISPEQFMHGLKHDQRESKLVFEAFSASLSCTAAILGWSVVLAGGGLTAFTGGASATLSVVAWSASVAGLWQCANGLMRVRNEIVDPSMNDEFDSEPWYQAVTSAMDAISLLGVGGATASTVRWVIVTRESTGKSLRQILKGLNRQERYKLTREILKINDPRLTNKLLKLKQLAGDLPKTFTSTQIRQTTNIQIRDAIGAGFSAAGSLVSGNLRPIAIGIYEEFQE